MLTMTDALSHPGLSVYRGPGQDRLSLREAYERNMLVFSVNRSHLSLDFGEPTILGYFNTIEEAAQELRKHPEYDRISAHHRGWGHTEECLVYCPWWKPLGEL